MSIQSHTHASPSNAAALRSQFRRGRVETTPTGHIPVPAPRPHWPCNLRPARAGGVSTRARSARPARCPPRDPSPTRAKLAASLRAKGTGGSSEREANKEARALDYNRWKDEVETPATKDGLSGKENEPAGGTTRRTVNADRTVEVPVAFCQLAVALNV